MVFFSLWVNGLWFESVAREVEVFRNYMPGGLREEAMWLWVVV